MITTGIHIPAVVLKKLASAVAGIHRETESLTFADFRKRARAWDGWDGSHPAFFRMMFSQKGAVTGFNARLLSKLEKKSTPHGFQAQVPMFGRADMAARIAMPALAEFLVNREIEYRKSHGLREMIRWTDEELQNASHIRFRTPIDILSSTCGCGTVSEILRALLADHEIALRDGESHHAHLNALSQNMSFLQRCQKSLFKEHKMAELWAEDRIANRWGIYTSYLFDNRSKNDRNVIAYRNKKGW